MQFRDVGGLKMIKKKKGKEKKKRENAASSKSINASEIEL